MGDPILKNTIVISAFLILSSTLTVNAATDTWLEISADNIAKQKDVSVQNSDGARSAYGCAPNITARVGSIAGEPVGYASTFDGFTDRMSFAFYHPTTTEHCVGPTPAQLAGELTTATSAAYMATSTPTASTAGLLSAFRRGIAQVRPTVVLVKTDMKVDVPDVTKLLFGGIGALLGGGTLPTELPTTKITSLHYLAVVGVSEDGASVKLLDTDGTEPRVMAMAELVEQMDCTDVVKYTKTILPFHGFVGVKGYTAAPVESIKAWNNFSYLSVLAEEGAD